MKIEFEPEIERAIKYIEEKISLPRWQIILALEGSKEFKKNTSKDFERGSSRSGKRSQ